MGKKNNKRKQKHSQKIMADSQISQKEQEALKLGMTMDQYEKHLKMQQQVWEQQEKKKEDEDENNEEQVDKNAIPVLKPGQNFKSFDQPVNQLEEAKVAKVKFEIGQEDIDPVKIANKQKTLEMLQYQSQSQQEQDEDIFKNLNQQGSMGQEKSTRAQRELGGEKNQKLAAQIKSDLDRLNQVKKRRELAAKKRQQEKAKKLAQQKKKQLEDMGNK